MTKVSDNHNRIGSSLFRKPIGSTSATTFLLGLRNKHRLGVSEGPVIRKKQRIAKAYKEAFESTSFTKSLIDQLLFGSGIKCKLEVSGGDVVTRDGLDNPLLQSHNDQFVCRLLRKFPGDQFWQHSDKTKLQRIPRRFQSIEEYVNAFDPLLLEECRAQFCSTWRQPSDTNLKDVYRVGIKKAERQGGGWYHVIILLGDHKSKWTFMEGSIAVLTIGNHGAARSNSIRKGANAANEGIVGLLRQHSKLDDDDPPTAILYVYIGDVYAPDSEEEDDEDDPTLKKFQLRGFWCLTILGLPVTEQWQHSALNQFRHINLQMQNVILKPGPENFPNCQEESPSLPKCLTENFCSYLQRIFNGPQLNAIQWAAMHTTPGTSSWLIEKQKSRPFTLIQGPPGTGKTHTVWGMLNVLHLVLRQRYHAALIKKLEHEIYKDLDRDGSEHFGSGFNGQVINATNLIHMLPKHNMLLKAPSNTAASRFTHQVLDGMKCIEMISKPKILVCAPSNAATDELLARVIGRGFMDGKMKVYQPSVARVGVDTLTCTAQEVSVEYRTNLLLGKSHEQIVSLEDELEQKQAQLGQQIVCLWTKLKDAAASCDCKLHLAHDHNYITLLQRLTEVLEEQNKTQVELSRLDILKQESLHTTEEIRANLQSSFVDDAEIVFTTVSSCGRKLFSHLKCGFDTVVVDEAAQASEVALLPLLTLDVGHCVLVGDPQQLPATVISKVVGSLLYERSLFERFQQEGCPAMLLSVQYRMHPKIRDFPSGYFYHGRLTDSESVTNLPDEIYYRNPLLKPYIFYDIAHGQESHGSGSVSYQNIHEAKFCRRIYDILQATLKSAGASSKVSVGIVTPYKLQLKCLGREFEDILKSEEGKELYINTVDAFQGQERDVIIMSCVRTSRHGVGFVADIRRMNVALTRARRALWVIGNAKALMQSNDWAALISDAKSRKCYLLSAQTSLSSKGSSDTKVFRTGGKRQFL
ncbi:hypothetical protein ACHQM5_024101 [Ranunculus cassubicifolius]